MQRITLALLVASCALASCSSKRFPTESSRPIIRPDDTPASQEQPAPVVADTGIDPFLEQYALTRRFSSGRPASIKVTPEGDAVLFLRSGPRDNVRNLYGFDPETGAERVLLTAEQILQGAEEQLTPEEKARRERMRLSARGIATYQLSKDGNLILVPLSGSLYVVNRTTGDVREYPSDKGFPIDPQFAPDGASIGVVRNGELYTIDLESGREDQLTLSASETVTNALAEFVAQEEMGRMHGYWWSPDSRKIVYQQTDVEGMEIMHLNDPRTLYNTPNTWPYPRPGKKNADVTLAVHDRGEHETVWVQWDHDEYPYLATVKWPENAPPTIVVQNRFQTESRILEIDPETGYTTELWSETDPAWIDLDQQMPRWLSDGSGFLWTTQRNGGWQIELHNRQGELIRTLTEPSLHYQRLVHLDEENATVLFTAKGDTPNQTHLYSAPLDVAAGQPRQLTFEPGSHSATVAENGTLMVRTGSTASNVSYRNVVNANGDMLGEIASVAEEPPITPQPEWTTVSDGEREFHCVIVRPTDFDPDKSYPVINYVYGGPTSQTVTASARSYLFPQWIANQGYIVVRIDARGTPGRGSQWLKIVKGNLIDIALRDQATATTLLCEKYPEMDADRVGMFGWSFGGYFSAMAAMRSPDVFAAGVAGAPVTDWQDYDTHYTERYLWTPEHNPDGYEASNVLTYADQLEVPLLIIHGTVDDNVYFAHALKMSDALFRAGKEHDFLPLSGFTHMVADPLVTQREYERILGFFREHLGTPR
ncbi:MAG: S9 family peptidase [Planctomycetota bacterium]|jgi:dipeptidyl-peptidase-4